MNMIMIRGYPEPTITWQREDKQNIVLRDGTGNIHKGKGSAIHQADHTAQGWNRQHAQK